MKNSIGHLRDIELGGLYVFSIHETLAAMAKSLEPASGLRRVYLEHWTICHDAGHARFDAKSFVDCTLPLLEAVQKSRDKRSVSLNEDVSELFQCSRCSCEECDPKQETAGKFKRPYCCRCNSCGSHEATMAAEKNFWDEVKEIIKSKLRLE